MDSAEGLFFVLFPHKFIKDHNWKVVPIKYISITVIFLVFTLYSELNTTHLTQAMNNKSSIIAHDLFAFLPSGCINYSLLTDF